VEARQNTRLDAAEARQNTRLDDALAILKSGQARVEEKIDRALMMNRQADIAKLNFTSPDEDRELLIAPPLGKHWSNKSSVLPALLAVGLGERHFNLPGKLEKREERSQRCTHTHTHTYIYIYVYIYKMVEEGERVCECGRESVCVCEREINSNLFQSLSLFFCREGYTSKSVLR
jgi:hypothetical protein